MSKSQKKGSVSTANTTTPASTNTAAANNGAATKSKSNKDDADRLLREEAEQAAQLELLRQYEREGELWQQMEITRRDSKERAEEKRRRKEAKMVWLAEKDQLILSLQTKLSTALRSAASDKDAYEVEIQRLLQRIDQLSDTVAEHTSRLDTVRNKAETDRTTWNDKLTVLQASLHRESEEHTICRTKFGLFREQTELQEQRLLSQCSMLETQLERLQRDKQERIDQLERELEHAVSLNKTLQEVVDVRDADDRRNVVLMNLLNNQLDENRQRSAQALEDEHERYVTTLRQLEESNLHIQQLTETNRLLVEEKETMCRAAEDEKKMYLSNLESIRFDVKFLHSELHTYKSKLSKQAKDAQDSEQASEERMRHVTQELQSTQDHLRAVQEELKIREREYYDKITLMNAQNTNARATMQQLQHRLQSETERRASESEATQAQLIGLRGEVEHLTALLENTKKDSCEAKDRFFEDAAALKRTVYKLQTSMVAQEKELSNALYLREEEVHALRAKLAEHFVLRSDPIDSGHSEEPLSADGSNAHTSLAVRDITALQAAAQAHSKALQEDLDATRKLAESNEVRLRAQITNQQNIIEALHLDIEATRKELNEKISLLSRENDRLRRVLDTGGLRGVLTS